MLLSGGIDSATSLYLIKDRYETYALTFNYHGLAEAEMRSARAVSRAAGVKGHRIVKLPDLKEAQDIPGNKFEGYPGTYIPMRNSIFYSFAASFAEETGAGTLVGGHNKFDLRVFRDVSPEFFDLLGRAIRSGSRRLSDRRLTILRPLEAMTKAQVVKLASERGVPLGKTWSCHKEGRIHCWECDGCLARTKSFDIAGIQDPLRLSTSGKIT